MSRKLNVSGTMKLLDEETFGSDETGAWPFSESITLDNDQPETVGSIVHGVGGEVRGELEIRAQLLNNKRIRVWLDTWLYEGTSEATQDLDGERHTNFLIYPNQTINQKYTVWNTAENCGDYVRIQLTAKNLSVN